MSIDCPPVYSSFVRFSETTANRIVFILSLTGAAIALYLTLAHWNVLSLTCSEISGCEAVAAHPSARGLGIPGLEFIPTALFGFLMFLTLAELSFLRVLMAGRPAARLFARIQTGIVAIAVLVYAYLTYLEAFVIRAWCQWCVASSIVTVLMLPVLLLTKYSQTETDEP